MTFEVFAPRTIIETEPVGGGGMEWCLGWDELWEDPQTEYDWQPAFLVLRPSKDGFTVVVFPGCEADERVLGTVPLIESVQVCEGDRCLRVLADGQLLVELPTVKCDYCNQVVAQWHKGPVCLSCEWQTLCEDDYCRYCRPDMVEYEGQPLYTFECIFECTYGNGVMEAVVEAHNSSLASDKAVRSIFGEDPTDSFYFKNIRKSWITQLPD